MSESETPAVDAASGASPGETPDPKAEALSEASAAPAATLDPQDEARTSLLAEPPENWKPYSLKRGARCNVCGDLRTSSAGCPACRPELEHLQGHLDETLAIKPRGLALTEFARGAGYLPRGAWFLLRNPRLWRYAAAPLLINIIVVVLGFFLAIYLADNLNDLSDGFFADWTGAWWLVAKVLEVMLYFVEVLFALFVPLLLAWLLTAFPLGILYKVLFTPFMEALGSATDKTILTGEKGGRQEYQTAHLTILYSSLDAVVLGLVQGLLIVLLLPVLLIPFVGSLIWMILPPALFACMDFSDIHLVRRGYDAGEKLRLWWLHHWRFLGYGTSFFFLLTIPFLNALAIPIATVGGALLYLELDRK